MVVLERLFQRDNAHHLFRKNGSCVVEGVIPTGKIRTLKLENPVFEDNDKNFEDYFERHSVIVPKFADSYVVSDFNPDTQFVVGEKAFSCYAVQFYRALS